MGSLLWRRCCARGCWPARRCAALAVPTGRQRAWPRRHAAGLVRLSRCCPRRRSCVRRWLSWGAWRRRVASRYRRSRRRARRPSRLLSLLTDIEQPLLTTPHVTGASRGSIRGAGRRILGRGGGGVARGVRLCAAGDRGEVYAGAAIRVSVCGRGGAGGSCQRGWGRRGAGPGPGGRRFACGWGGRVTLVHLVGVEKSVSGTPLSSDLYLHLLLCETVVLQPAHRQARTI
mmetsp:Transcript_12413/g.36588  ORF Transcript_12413/g.36588 Transcript_12413/m.36588 type:complete len:230 (-) Transcript_12413:453-1142(-)